MRCNRCAQKEEREGIACFLAIIGVGETGQGVRGIHALQGSGTSVCSGYVSPKRFRENTPKGKEKKWPSVDSERASGEEMGCLHH